MPVWRYVSSIDKKDSGLRSVISTDEKKISILLWNQNPARNDEGIYSTSGDRLATISLKNAKFNKGLRRVYRIDLHAFPNSFNHCCRYWYYKSISER